MPREDLFEPASSMGLAKMSPRVVKTLREKLCGLNLTSRQSRQREIGEISELEARAE
jgi:hypothetical protein